MMGLRDLANRLKAKPEELDAERLHDRFGGMDLTPIDQLECRTPSRVGGEVKRIRVAPRKGIPALEMVLTDGTADVVAVFTGRRHIAGIEHGRAVIIEGIAREERGRKVMLNPAYTLISS
ncbi:unannotated protein [freshwater metagenome]|uniref:Unannotated protein n=1 Tax=freshwater metagenome TaxID=449393 RepID=A0A6J7FJK0_9ZZZZ|nr:DNA-binding protein [Actinomycetota bacterium]